MSEKWNKLVAILAAAVCGAALVGGGVVFVRPYLSSPARSPRSAERQAKVEERPALGVWGREELIRGAGEVALAEAKEKTVMPPGLELEREKAETNAEGAQPWGSGGSGIHFSIPLGLSNLSR